jgi:hypothetical protein
MKCRRGAGEIPIPLLFALVPHLASFQFGLYGLDRYSYLLHGSYELLPCAAKPIGPIFHFPRLVDVDAGSVLGPFLFFIVGH